MLNHQACSVCMLLNVLSSHYTLYYLEPAVINSMGHYTMFIVPHTFGEDVSSVIYSPLRHAVVVVSPGTYMCSLLYTATYIVI